MENWASDWQASRGVLSVLERRRKHLEREQRLPRTLDFVFDSQVSQRHIPLSRQSTALAKISMERCGTNAQPPCNCAISTKSGDKLAWAFEHAPSHNPKISDLKVASVLGFDFFGLSE